MMPKIVIRSAADSDFPGMAHLLRTLATTFIVPGMPPEAAATFLRENDQPALLAYRAAGHVTRVADIDGDDMSCTTFEQHLREAAGRGADIEAIQTFR